MSLITNKKTASTSLIVKIVSREPSTIRNLPEELLLKIFELLSAKELVKVSKVCKQWNCIAEDKGLWQALFIKLNFRSAFTPRCAVAYMKKSDQIDKQAYIATIEAYQQKRNTFFEKNPEQKKEPQNFY